MPRPLYVATLLLVVAALVSLPLFLSVPNVLNNPVLHEVHDASHTALFFLIQGLTLSILRRQLHWRWFPAIAVASLFSTFAGAAIELIQPWFGRHRSWSDLHRDMSGIVIATLVYLMIQPGVRWPIRGGLLAMACAVGIWAGSDLWPWIWAQHQRNQHFPILLDAERPALDLYLQDASGGRRSIEPAPVAWQGNDSRAVKLSLPGHKTYPGLSLRSPVPDWSEFRYLRGEFWLAGDTPATIAINIYSQRRLRKPWRYRKLELQPGLNTLAWDLTEKGDLAGERITDLLIYSISADQTMEVWVDELRLTPGQGDDLEAGAN